MGCRKHVSPEDSGHELPEHHERSCSPYFARCLFGPLFVSRITAVRASCTHVAPARAPSHHSRMPRPHPVTFPASSTLCQPCTPAPPASLQRLGTRNVCTLDHQKFRCDPAQETLQISRSAPVGYVVQLRVGQSSALTRPAITAAVSAHGACPTHLA